MPARADNPAALAEHEPQWLTRAAQLIDQIQVALDGLPGVDAAEFDHIGSTSVPGLVAKPFLDLQMRILPLPTDDDLSPRLAPLGFRRAQGARPDSPGVRRDIPRGDEDAPDDVWEKSLFFAADAAAILHVRRTDSPWGRYTVWFRDWLRANSDARLRYEAVKRELSEANVGKADYDDYTRGKTAFFDEVQSAFTSWASCS